MRYAYNSDSNSNSNSPCSSQEDKIIHFQQEYSLSLSQASSTDCSTLIGQDFVSNDYDSDDEFDDMFIGKEIQTPAKHQTYIHYFLDKDNHTTNYTPEPIHLLPRQSTHIKRKPVLCMDEFTKYYK
jgi:hypothetical protein